MLVAIYCAIRCVLYPGTKIIVASNALKQANEVLLKIQDELLPISGFLRGEIASCKIGQNDASIYFQNNSWIKTRTSTQNARSARANVVVIDEYRMVDPVIITSVIREFLKAPRRPGFLGKPEYKHYPKERNVEMYLSSAYYKSSQAYKKAQAYTVNFLDDKKKYFICGLPYQISIRDGLLLRSQVQDQMSEADFDPISFSIEFCASKIHLTLPGVSILKQANGETLTK